MNALESKKSGYQSAMRALDRMTKPNWITFVDYRKRVGRRMAYYRFVIEKHADNCFMVREFRYNLPNAPYLCMTLSHKSYPNVFMANERVEHLSSLMDIEGAELMNKEHGEVVELFAGTFTGNRLIPVCPEDTKSFLPSAHTAQRIKGGLHVYVKVDSMGNTSVQDANHINLPLGENNIEHPGISCFLETLMQPRSFRGALIEGFIDGDDFIVVDADFIGNKHIGGMPWSTRSAILQRIVDHASNDAFNVTFSAPIDLSDVDLYDDDFFIIRSKSSLFIQRDQSYAKRPRFLCTMPVHVEAVERRGSSTTFVSNDEEEKTFELPDSYLPLNPHYENYYISFNKNKRAYI
ncbi:hypothetical protein [uncultured Alteromonas sp.]|jgi:hypothetical protein|uniref:hypothetical protein n=1 Tax=uncultured Alteromonas sp. TaxID=179113 RepID=UPI0030CACE2F|tara:strand:+ start:14137 stop:15183 length:1047 start_codon:yes stop_codon:yes gene_type:complete